MDQQVSGEISGPVLAPKTIEIEDDAITLAKNSGSSIGCVTGRDRLELNLDKQPVFPPL
ncbi:MAG: hypothetical protein ABJP70_00325 [Erythrobacter sp.]